MLPPRLIWFRKVRSSAQGYLVTCSPFIVVSEWVFTNPVKMFQTGMEFHFKTFLHMWPLHLYHNSSGCIFSMLDLRNWTEPRSGWIKQSFGRSRFMRNTQFNQSFRKTWSSAGGYLCKWRPFKVGRNADAENSENKMCPGVSTYIPTLKECQAMGKCEFVACLWNIHSSHEPWTGQIAPIQYSRWPFLWSCEYKTNSILTMAGTGTPQEIPRQYCAVLCGITKGLDRELPRRKRCQSFSTQAISNCNQF